MNFTSDWHARQKARHAEEVEAGQHDAQCEWGPRLLPNPRGELGETFLWICHCAKRQRINAGLWKVPGPLEHRAPDCPQCGREVDFDGDCFNCPACHVTWGTDYNDQGEFNDDYGDLGRPMPLNRQVSGDRDG